MRFSTALGVAGVVAAAALPVTAQATPLRAAAAIPAKAAVGTPALRRAPTRVDDTSELRRGFPILPFVGLFVAVTTIVVLAAGGGRSPG